MILFFVEGVIFILVRKLIIPVALIVAWLGVTSFVFVKFNSNKNRRVEYEKTLALKVENEIKAIAEKELEAQDASNIENDIANEQSTRGNVTSRSGVRRERENNTIYYEDLNINVREDEIEMLERIVQAEAGGSGYDGMLAVANVVLNRVKSERFPNTVEEVIFARRQFTPISDGRYYSVTVSDGAKQVVEDALNGARLVEEDALYFCTPTAPGKGWFETDLRKIAYVAPHNFYGYK